MGGARPYFKGARVQKGHGFGSLFSGLLRSVRGALALGKRALTTGAQIAGGRGWSEYQEGDKTKSYSSRKSPDEQSSRHTPPQGKRIKRTAPSTKRIKRTAARRRTSPTKRQRQRPDVFSYDGVRTPTIVRGSDERTGLVRRTTNGDL